MVLFHGYASSSSNGEVEIINNQGVKENTYYTSAVTAFNGGVVKEFDDCFAICGNYGALVFNNDAVLLGQSSSIRCHYGLTKLKNGDLISVGIDNVKTYGYLFSKNGTIKETYDLGNSNQATAYTYPEDFVMTENYAIAFSYYSGNRYIHVFDINDGSTKFYTKSNGLRQSNTTFIEELSNGNIVWGTYNSDSDYTTNGFLCIYDPNGTKLYDSGAIGGSSGRSMKYKKLENDTVIILCSVFQPEQNFVRNIDNSGNVNYEILNIPSSATFIELYNSSICVVYKTNSTRKIKIIESSGNIKLQELELYNSNVDSYADSYAKVEYDNNILLNCGGGVYALFDTENNVLSNGKLEHSADNIDCKFYYLDNNNKLMINGKNLCVINSNAQVIKNREMSMNAYSLYKEFEDRTRLLTYQSNFALVDGEGNLTNEGILYSSTLGTLKEFNSTYDNKK